MTGRLVKTWKTRQDLESTLLKSLMHALNDHPQVGWIRANTAASEEAVNRLNDEMTKNKELRELLSSAEQKLARAEAAMAPKFDNIAGLEDIFSIEYKFKQTNQGRTSEYERSVDLSWKQIFFAVASQLDLARPPSYCILYGLRALAADTGSFKEPSKISDFFIIRIKNQLIALGLVSSHVSKTTAGSYSEFLSLTALGSKLVLEMSITRKV